MRLWLVSIARAVMLLEAVSLLTVLNAQIEAEEAVGLAAEEALAVDVVIIQSFEGVQARKRGETEVQSNLEDTLSR